MPALSRAVVTEQAGLDAQQAAVLFGDSSVIADIHRWALSAFAARGVPDAAGTMAELRALVQQALAEYPLSSRALSAADQP